ncbi:DUF3060 domain-containing protein [Microbacterium sp. SSW1-49]|uniref:DUF3060 domain-containing protein n=1 Tax=Microbacterium croceum TaxID=2851645 RepID=A0ABT0FIP1_9MICO|nr:DUF3060 domain-containing protein [Microbacterium croceum]MCK2037932.1 DUF3060 domain-containing protein [Microbacterium croceum]
MRAARRHIAAMTPLAVAVMLLTGCTVSIVDPAAGNDRSPRAQDGDPAPQSDATPRPSAREQQGDDDAASSGLSAPNAAERERLTAAATITMTCPDGPLDQDGSIIRVEGACADLVIDIDAGAVIADDVDRLQLRGSGTVVFAGTIGTVTISGSANQIIWSGATPVLKDSGSANSLGRG